MPGSVKLLLLLTLLVLVGAGAFLAGSSSSPSIEDATEARDQTMEATYPQARKLASARGIRQGRRVGMARGRREGTRNGKAAGAKAGQAELARQREQEAANQISQEDIWCDTDGYCLQKSPGWGGPECPPNTVENAGGVVCVPTALFKD